MLTVHSITITGDGSPHPISATLLQAKWVQVLADPGNGAVVFIGGPEVSSINGFPVTAGAAEMLPPIAELMNVYDLTQIHYWASSGSKLYVLYGV